ncbi:MAG: hypothetical protein FJY29_06965 [Betaproteobacteria bacterium]|nr:hypothetical protein [Betaproteobacteria bacterium]
MSFFPSLRGLQSRCWLSVEQSGGQERAPKPRLRKNFRGQREFLKKNAVLGQTDWGKAHILRFSEFLRAASSAGATPEFWNTPWAAYVPMGSELQLLGHCPMENCWLPHALPNGVLNWYPWQSGIELWAKDARSLPQPPASVQLSRALPSNRSLTLVITPCLAVDLAGTRLGYGGGYYDRFLEEHGNHVLSVACVPHELRLAANTLPRETHDVSIDVIVTEKTVDVLSTEKFRLYLTNMSISS